MEIDVEMKIIHCSIPEENPIPQWLRKKEKAEAVSDLIAADEAKNIPLD